MIEVEIVNKIEDKIKEYQDKTGATKTWIAKQANIKKQTLNTIEKSQNITIQTLIKLSVVLDCDINELFEARIYKDKCLIKNDKVSLK